MDAERVSRRLFLKLAGVSVGAVALAACTVPTAAPSTGAAETTGGETAGAPAEAVTLTLGLHWEAAFRPHQDEFDNKWKEAHPNVEFQITYNTWSDHNQIVPTWAAAGQLPDIIYVHGRYAFPWNFEGIMVPTQPYIDNDPDFDIAGVWPEALRLYAYDGAQYEIPYDHGPIIMGYNKDLFDAAGMAYPADDWTMDDMLETAKALTTADVWGFSDYYGLNNEQGIGLVGPWGGDVLDDTETKILLDTPEAKAGLQFFADLIHVHKVAPLPAEAQAVAQGVAVAGIAALFPVASWDTPTLVEFANFGWDVAPWPAGPVKQVTGSFGSGFGITRDSKNPDVAWSYLHDYLSKEGMEFMWGASGRGSPARPAAYQSWLDSENSAEHASFFKDALEKYAVTGRPYYTLAGGEILDIFNRNTSLVQSGDMTVDEAVAAIIADGTPVLEEAAARLQGG